MLEPVLAQLRQKYPEEVRTVFRHFPLPSHPLSALAAQAAEAAGKQDKFFEMTDYLFEHQADWSQPFNDKPDEFKTYLYDTALDLGLDVDQFKTDLESKEIVDKIAGASRIAQEIGLDYTPYVLFNNTILQGIDMRTFTAVIDLYNFQDKMFKECPAPLADLKKSYTATVKTTKGDVVIKLFADKAPTTVGSFVFLAQEGWFDDTPFHRVIPGFVAQAGDPTGTGAGGPGYIFGNEINADLAYDKAGVVGMANSGVDSNGSQFFITYAPVPELNGGYTIFGEVIEGMDVVESLAEVDPTTEQGLTAVPDRIISVKINVK